MIFESFGEVDDQLDVVQELSAEVSNAEPDPSHLIDLKPKQSLFNFSKNQTFNLKIQPQTDGLSRNAAVENDIFESPRSDDGPDLQIGEGEFDSAAYEKAYHAVSL